MTSPIDRAAEALELALPPGRRTLIPRQARAAARIAFESIDPDDLAEELLYQFGDLAEELLYQFGDRSAARYILAALADPKEET